MTGQLTLACSANLLSYYTRCSPQLNMRLSVAVAVLLVVVMGCMGTTVSALEESEGVVKRWEWVVCAHSLYFCISRLPAQFAECYGVFS